MASFVYAVWSITNVASMHCAVRPEISPCTCEPYLANTVDLFCERVESFHQIVDALSNKFPTNITISLKISHSQLLDLEMRSFKEMNLNVNKLKMISNNLRSVPELPFRGMANIEYLSLAENDLEEIPKHVLNHLPKISSLDLGLGRIRAVNHDDLKGIQNVKYLILVSNHIQRVDTDAIPKSVLTLHLGRNQITNLNGTLRNLMDMNLLFINMNNITTLENELPPASQNLKMILAQNNSLEHLPQSMKDLPNLESLYFENNKLKSFDGVFKFGKHIQRLFAANNRIENLASDEFRDAAQIEEIDIALNNIKSLNKSLLPMKKLRSANFSFNELIEFSMAEIRGLDNLKSFDISFNRIERLTGRQENLIDPESFLVELRLQYNRLRSLDGALMGLNKLRILTLSHNQISKILPDDFIGLESLEILDISHNQLLSLEETSTTFLPSLKILKVQFNNLTKLEKDFHGLPVLCQANLTNNKIESISSELVSKTRCTNHGVAGKLEIWLENNPIMCNERVRELCLAMDGQDARIRGHSDCLESGAVREICAEPPIFLSAPLIEKIIQTQIQQGSSAAIVQVLVPASLIPKTVIKAAQPTTSTTTTTTMIPSIATSPSTRPVENETSIILSVLKSTEPPVSDLQTEFPSIIYSPLIVAEIPPSAETDENHVRGEYPQFILPVPDSSKQLSIHNEPPENP